MMLSLHELPVEVITDILAFCDVEDILAVERVS